MRFNGLDLNLLVALDETPDRAKSHRGGAQHQPQPAGYERGSGAPAKLF